MMYVNVKDLKVGDFITNATSGSVPYFYKSHIQEKVIFNDPATILIKDGKKYVSKAHDEPFDPEKGLLMCLAKANGITHLELKRMIKNATVQNKGKTAHTNKGNVCVDSGNKKETVESQPIAVSPKGRHLGKPYNFNVGDKVIVRDCKYYKYTTNSSAKPLLNRVWNITLDNSDFAGSLYVINGVEFAGSELEPVKD